MDKVFLSTLCIFLAFCVCSATSHGQEKTEVQSYARAFAWPNGKKVAVSLTFDDARESQVLVGTALLDQHGIKATFYVVPAAVERQLEGWKRAVENGHEIGNHSLLHPCSGNFLWSRDKALENYTLKKMKKELQDCNVRIHELLGVTPTVFAYPCGQKYIGRGEKTKSYVPLIAKMFESGRGWMDEAPNDPGFRNFAQLTGIEMDGKTVEQIIALIEQAKKSGQWLVLAGHEIGESGPQTTRIDMLKQLAEYVNDPKNEVWVERVGRVGRYLTPRP